MENESENFTINVDVTGNGVEVELDVIPGVNDYVILLDGIELTTISHEPGQIPPWKQIDGNLDQATVSALGDAIESRLM